MVSIRVFKFLIMAGTRKLHVHIFLRLFTVRYKLNRKSSNVSMQAVKRKNKNLNNARTHLIWWHINDYAHPYLPPLAMHVVLVYFVFLWTPGFLGSISKLNVVFDYTCKITGITEEIRRQSILEIFSAMIATLQLIHRNRQYCILITYEK